MNSLEIRSEIFKSGFEITVATGNVLVVDDNGVTKASVGRKEGNKVILGEGSFVAIEVQSRCASSLDVYALNYVEPLVTHGPPGKKLSVVQFDKEGRGKIGCGGEFEDNIYVREI